MAASNFMPFAAPKDGRPLQFEPCFFQEGKLKSKIVVRFSRVDPGPRYMGFNGDLTYTLEEVWVLCKNVPRQRNFTAFTVKFNNINVVKVEELAKGRHGGDPPVGCTTFVNESLFIGTQNIQANIVKGDQVMKFGRMMNGWVTSKASALPLVSQLTIKAWVVIDAKGDEGAWTLRRRFT